MPPSFNAIYDLRQFVARNDPPDYLVYLGTLYYYRGSHATFLAAALQAGGIRAGDPALRTLIVEHPKGEARGVHVFATLPG